MTNNDYIPLTDRDRIMGITEPRKKTELEKNAFNYEYKYLINNTDVVTGNIIGNILPFALKVEIMQGKQEIDYKGMNIKRIVEQPQEQEEPKEELKPVKKAVKKSTRKRVD